MNMKDWAYYVRPDDPCKMAGPMDQGGRQILKACRARSRHWPPCFCQTCMTPTREELGLPSLSKSVENT